MSQMREQVQRAIGAHGMWKSRLQKMLEGNDEERLDPAEVAPDDRCEFGKWLHGLTGTESAQSAIYQEVLQLHRQFHRAAADVVRKARQGDAAGARVSMALNGDFAKASAALTGKMMEWSRQT